MTPRTARWRLRPEAIVLVVGCLLGGCFAREPKSTERSIQAPPSGSPAPDAAGARPTVPAERESPESLDADDGEATPAPRREATPQPTPAAPKSGSPRQKSMPRRAAPSATGRGDAPHNDALQNEDEGADEIEASDCPGARQRKKDICDLAESICGLVERDPNVASVERHCEEARQRCRTADARTAERCQR